MLDFSSEPMHLISRLPPWDDVASLVNCSASKEIMANNCIFQQYKKDNYPGYQEIYTDGSKIVDRNTTTACGIYVQCYQITCCWKIRSDHSVVSAELYAIFKALQYIEVYMRGQHCLIFTDSLTALQMIAGCTTSYMQIVNKIQELLINLNNTQIVILHWVKSHNGIKGNEVADQVANLGHKNNRSENYKLAKEEWL